MDQNWITWVPEIGRNESSGLDRDWITWPNENIVDPKPDLAVTASDQPTVQFITGDALMVLRKMAAASVNTIITSPPYYPAKRSYNGTDGIGELGYEPTSKQYIARLVSIFSEAHRVLADDGLMWVVIGDSYSSSGGTQSQNTMHSIRPGDQKVAVQGVKRQSTLGERPAKSLLNVPHRLVEALQDDGWIFRDEIIWHKMAPVPESVKDRTTRAHEYCFMLSKRGRYFFDQSYNRQPATTEPHPPKIREKNVIVRSDMNDGERIWGADGMRNRRSVWKIKPESYRGPHPAPFPSELVRLMLMPTCPPGGVVLDIFGGSGTTALVAVDNGFNAIDIDSNPDFIEEARNRIKETQLCR